MSSIISGLNNSIASQIQDLGANLIFVQRIPPTVGGRLPPEVFSRKKLTLDDAKAIGELPVVQDIAPVLQYFAVNMKGKAVSYGYRERDAENTDIIDMMPRYELLK